MTGEDLKNAIRRQPGAFAATLVLVACGLAFYFRMDALDEARQAAEQAQKDETRVANNIKFAVGLKQATDQITDAAEKFEERLINPSQLASNLQMFYRMESETGVKLVDVKQGAARPQAKGDAYVAVPYTVRIHGDIEQVYSFLRRLEGGPGFGRIVVMSVSRTESAATQDKSPARARDVAATINAELLGTP